MTTDDFQIGVYQQFKLTAQTFANKTAITETHQCITFSNLKKEAEHSASKLQKLGVAAGDRCIVSLPNSINTAIVILAIWRINGIPVLINDQSPNTHIQHAVTQTQSKLFITSIRNCNLAIPATCFVITDTELRQREATSSLNYSTQDYNSIPTEKPYNPASVIFTSGSTGLPKGVMQSHSTLVNCSKSIASLLGLTPRDRLLCPLPWSFDYGFGQLLSTLLVGIPQILPQSSNPFDVCNTIEQHQPTVLAGVPSLLANLVLGVSPLKKTNVQSVRLITTTGSAISEKVLEHLFKIFTKTKFSLNYGLTETYRSTSLPTALAHTHPNSVGYAVPGVDISIIRPDGSEASAGEIGEIVHQGAGVFMGYWGDELATQKAFKTLPIKTSSRTSSYNAVYTGDLGYKDKQGLVYLSGRKDRQIKSMGVRIYPEEIEACLKHHPIVKDAAIVSSSHDIYGEIITAVVTARPNTSEDEKNIRRSIRLYCKDKLNNYMIPREIICIHHMPRTISGKIDYIRIKDMLKSGSTSESIVNT